jgi:hypothetical protein
VDGPPSRREWARRTMQHLLEERSIPPCRRQEGIIAAVPAKSSSTDGGPAKSNRSPTNSEDRRGSSQTVHTHWGRFLLPKIPTTARISDNEELSAWPCRLPRHLPVPETDRISHLRSCAIQWDRESRRISRPRRICRVASAWITVLSPSQDDHIPYVRASSPSYTSQHVTQAFQAHRRT